LRPALSLFLFSALPSCASFSLAVEELEAVHDSSDEVRLLHRTDVERPSVIGRQWRRSFLSRILPGLNKVFAKPRPETLGDPARVCRESILELKEVDPDEPREVATAVTWAAKVLEQDPWPLSRADAAAVLAAVRPPATPSAGEGAFDENAVRDALRDTSTANAASREGRLSPAPLRTVYERAIRTLGETPYRTPSEATAVLAFLSQLFAVEPDPGFRLLLESAIRRTASRTASLALRRGLKDPSEFVRESCVEAIFASEGTASLPDLIRVVEADPDPNVRRRLVRACKQAEDPLPPDMVETVIDFLYAATGDPDSSVATNAMVVLSERTGQPLVLDREHWRAWRRDRILGRPPSGSP
jgi:hypothetical protein